MDTRLGRLLPRIGAGAAQSPAEREPAFSGLQALAAAAKKKQPVTHDVSQRNPGHSVPTVSRTTIPPCETGSN
ncbi:hypothetical protein GCM10009664_23750 [Kitasatospora gansuensis]